MGRVGEGYETRQQTRVAPKPVQQKSRREGSHLLILSARRILHVNRGNLLRIAPTRLLPNRDVLQPRSIDAAAFSAVTKYSRQENTFEQVLLTHAWKNSSHRKYRQMVTPSNTLRTSYFGRQS